MQLNATKSTIRSLVDVRRDGMEMLGTCIGPTASRGRFLARKIDDLLRVLPRLEVLPYQHALLLLRICFQQDLRHLQRTLDTSELQHLWASLDQQLQELAFRISGARHTSIPDDNGLRIDVSLTTLPVRLGGLRPPLVR
jgi:hypothetical protein